MPTIVGDSFGDVERLWLADRSRQQAGIENALNRLLQAQAQRQDRKQRERQFQFNLARENSDLADQRERMKMERERLDETIRSNKEREKFNFKLLEQPKASVAAAETAGRSRMELENLKQGERTRENYSIARNMSELLNQYQDVGASEAEMKQFGPAVAERAKELHGQLQEAAPNFVSRLAARFTGGDTARTTALDSMRNQIPYNVPIDVWEPGTAEELQTRATDALGEKRKLLEPMIDQGMRTGADLIRQDPSGRWMPGVPAYNMPQGGTPSAPSRGAMMGGNPQAFRFIQKASELAEQREAVTNTIDQVESQIPSFLAAPPELHGQIKEARKAGKDLLRNLTTEQKDIEKRLEELRKEAQEKADKEKEEGKKSVDMKQFSFGASRKPDPAEVRRQAEAAIAAKKDPIAVYRRALELGVDLNQ